jgi:site-specific DNA recombinase
VRSAGRSESAPRLVALVVRVSTTRQADNEEGSLKTQLQRLRAHLAYKTDACGEDWREVALYELRAVSGKSSLRGPDLQRLVRDIEAGRVNTVLCTALDRVSRSVKDFLNFFELLAEHHVEFVSLREQYDTTSPQGKLFVTIMMALAEFEREQTALRTKDAVAARSERGLWNGGRLLGYDLDPDCKGYLLVNEQEAEVVRHAFAAYLQCGSLAGTAEMLNSWGYRTKAFTSRRGTVHPGKPFHITRLQYLLKNRAFIGMKEIAKQKQVTHTAAEGEYREVPAVWPAIIDRETFDAVQALMAKNGQTRTNQAREHKHVYVLNTGLLFCGACGSQMEGRSGTGRLGTRYYYYACTRKDCGMRVVAPEIEGAVLDRLGVLAREDGILTELVAATNSRLQRQLPTLGRRRKALERDLAQVGSQADQLLSDWGNFPESQRRLVREKLTALGERKEQLESALGEVDTEIAEVRTASLDADTVRTALGQIGAIYAQLRPFEQKELFRLLVHRAEIKPRRMVLEIKTGACSSLAQAPDAVSGAKRYFSPIRLPELVTQSVCSDKFPARIPSLRHLTRTRARKGVAVVAAEWQELLAAGTVTSQSELAHRMGVSRARVSQVLGLAARGAPGVAIH